MEYKLQVLTALEESIQVPVQQLPAALPHVQLPQDSQEEQDARTADNGSAWGQQTGTSIPLPPAYSQPGGPGLFFPAVLALLLVGTAAALLYRHFRRAGRKTKEDGGGRIKAAQVHELGARDSQQDAFGIAGLDTPETGVLAAVADGMGGLVNSGQVSQAIISAMLDAYAPAGNAAPDRQLQMLLQQALRRVEALTRGSTAQSGSTLVACLIRNGSLSWLSVGDSRIYLWRGGGLIQLNQDHDFHHDLALLALQDEMSWEEADRDPRRESLTSYIGGGFPRKVDYNPEPVALRPGDRVLLASDGIYRALSQDELAEHLSGTAAQAAQAILAAIQQKRLPQQDNFTALVLEI